MKVDRDILVAIDEVASQYKSFWDFCREDMFGENGLLDARPLSACHKEMCEELSRAKAKGQSESLTLWPRGHLKTTIGSVAYPIWRLIYNPDLRILVTSETEKMSGKIVDSVRAVLESDQFKAKYGDWVNPKHWRGKSIVISPRRNKTLRDPSLAVASVETAEVGGHWDLIIADDLHSEKNVTSREMIEKVVKHYQLLFPLLEPDGEIFVRGTRWDENDLYAQIASRLPKSRVSVRRVMDEQGAILFPEKFDAENIADLRRKMGTYQFNLQYMNEPTAAEDAVFRPEWLQSCLWTEGVSPKDMTYYIAVDPAISEERGADYTAIVVCGAEKHKDVWHIVDLVNERISPTGIIEHIFRLAKIWNPSKVGIEVVSYQKMLRNWVEREMTSRKHYFFIEELKPGQRSKAKRIEALMPRVEYRCLRWFPRFQIVTDQFRRFRLDREQSHDDVIDAIAYLADLVPPFVGKAEATSGHADKDLPKPIYAEVDPNAGRDWATMDFSRYRRVG